MSRSLRTRMRRWHRSLGAFVALGAVFLVATGITLNHASDWQLDQTGVASRWVLQQYGIHIAPPQYGWPSTAGWISQCADKLWLNQQVLGSASQLSGVAELDGLSFVAARHKLWLMDDSGQIIDRLTPPDLPSPILAIARYSDKIALQTPTGWLASSSDMLQWTALDIAPQPTPAQNLPATLARQISQQAAQQELSWERVLLDLHTGRFFGRYGPYVIDALAIGMGLLALSGLWLWFKSRPRHHKG